MSETKTPAHNPDSDGPKFRYELRVDWPAEGGLTLSSGNVGPRGMAKLLRDEANAIDHVYPPADAVPMAPDTGQAREPRVLAEQPEAEVIRAPFTRAQQQALYRWQSDGTKHPFTCPHCSDQPLSVGAHWYCPDCGYTQYWAHAFMARPPAVAATPDGAA